MELAAGGPSRWLVTLTDGGTVKVWADALTKPQHNEDNEYVFGVLMDVDLADQQAFDVTARTPRNERRVEVAVARFPRASVRSVVTG